MAARSLQGVGLNGIIARYEIIHTYCLSQATGESDNRTG